MPSNQCLNEVVFNLEPTTDCPRNSEGAFVALKSGRILYKYTQFYGGDRDHSPAQIVQIHSDDQGRTWSKPPQVVVQNEGGQNVMSVSLLRLKSGPIALFYLLKQNSRDCRPWMRISTDEAQTWSAPRCLVPEPGYYVMNNDRVLQHYTGRLIAPLALHRLHDGKLDSRAMLFWYLSDDDGQNWREAQSWYSIPAVSDSGLQEPGVVEWYDGSLFSWARTDQGAQFGCRSTDHGQTWSPPEPTCLKSPLGPASIKMLPRVVGWLALYNDHSGAFPFVPNQRTPLVAAISPDGKTWPRHKLVEYDPDGAFHYTAIHYTQDESVLLAYCAGDRHVGWLNRLRIRRLSLNWFFT